MTSTRRPARMGTSRIAPATSAAWAAHPRDGSGEGAGKDKSITFEFIDVPAYRESF